MGPSGAFREITDRIQTHPPWREREREEVSAPHQPPEPRKPGKWARAGGGAGTGRTSHGAKNMYVAIVLAIVSASP